VWPLAVCEDDTAANSPLTSPPVDVAACVRRTWD